ncbi:MAG: hypothetical protein V3T25_01520, partial [Gemmatimonadota bacterium]
MNPKSCVAAWRRPAGILRATLVTAILLGSTTPLLAQDPLDADSDDVESIDAIIAALYDVISGPAGQERDWNRFRSLFLA